MRLLLKAPFNRYSGYGNDAVDIAIWMTRAGVDVYPWPTSIMPGLPQEFTDLLVKKPRKGDSAYDVALQFIPPFDIKVSDKMPKRLAAGLPQKIASVHAGWSMWEQDKLTPTHMSGHGVGQHPWRLLDVMYVTTKMNIEAFQFFDPKTEYVLAPCGITPEKFPVSRRSIDGPTKFCMIGELHRRKDPFVAISAFNDLRREYGSDFDAELHLKTTTPGVPPELGDILDRVFVHYEFWHWDQVIEWMADMTCYLAPSRGEGNHKPPMEFMATGGTVIATDWSGPTNWLHPDVAYPLDYELKVIDETDPYAPKQARADREHLKELMLHVHQNRLEARDKGIRAASWIRNTMSWESRVEHVIRDLERRLAAK